jgi:molybdopterin/thiamine biosynthesis adenylyltransferase
MGRERIKIDVSGATGLPRAGAASLPHERFDRFKLIGWWDQRKLGAARVLVIGAGALGNEIVKNLMLLGVGQVLIADRDRIEHSNLSRSVLFRAEDAGKPKAQVAAHAAAGIWPDARVHFFDGDIVHGLGAGAYRWADLVIGGLDNREARLAINRQCWRLGKPWIDGAIEQIEGTCRVFVPGRNADAAGKGGRADGPCYECTMSQRDWELLEMRRSCNLLTAAEMEGGKTPTTPTISSIIAGVQCQEAVKILHGLETIGGRGWVFSGLATEAYQVEFQRKEDCLSHDPLDSVVSLAASTHQITLAELLKHGRELAGADAVLELGRDYLEKLTCGECGSEEAVFKSVRQVPADAALCPDCRGRGRQVRRQVKLFHTIRGDEAFIGKRAVEIGVPAMDILTARSSANVIGMELAADAHAVLGPLEGEGIELV